MAIQVPPKVWRPKQQNRFTPPEYANDIDEGVFEFKEFGNAVYRPKEPWPEGAERDDIIHFDAEQHTEELEKNIRTQAGNHHSSHEVLGLLLPSRCSSNNPRLRICNRYRYSKTSMLQESTVWAIRIGNHYGPNSSAVRKRLDREM